MTRRFVACAVVLTTLAAVPELSLADPTRKAPPPTSRERARSSVRVADGPFELELTTGIRQYTWKEYRDQPGAQDPVLTESGVQFVLGALPRLSLGAERRIVLEAETQLYFGGVGYDGATQGGVPLQSNTDYFGFEINPRAGYVFSIGRRFQLTPLGGFSVESWKRDLNDSRAADGLASNGYVERYTAFFLQGAVRGAYVVSPDLRFTSTVSLKLPLSISESVDRSRHGGAPLSLSPGLSPRLGLEVGATYHRFLAAATFDTWTLSASPVENGFRQPRSTRTMFGFRVGYQL